MRCWKSTHTWLTVILCCIGRAQATAVLPAPIVVQPSQYWEGDDGAWSTFSLRVGTPEQVVRVLVSTSIPNAITVANSSCPQGLASTCASSRGGVFAPNSSTTWHYRNTFGLYPELNYTSEEEPAYYGLDTIGLGLTSSATTLPNQVVAAVESNDYYIGYLGIDPQATNWTLNFTDETPSLFKTLSTKDLIPSFTYSYTAGAPYRLKGVLGSLVFGGYDASRVAPHDLDFTMADDVSRDLVVGIQGITAHTPEGSASLLPDEGALAFIDSTFPYFVLPLGACEAFETQFGLEWNPHAGNGGLYTLTDTQHQALQTSNPNITFTLGNSLEGGPVMNITLPYAAFDLQASPPLVSATTRYFPLLRAANETQITLGRAFLQETMLVVDYARSNFSLWPCVWNADASENIVALGSQNTPDSTSVAMQQGTSQQHALNLGLGLGVGLGVGVPLLALLAFVLIAYYRRRWPFRARTTSHERIDETPSEVAGSELEAKSTRAHTSLYTSRYASTRTSAYASSYPLEKLAGFEKRGRGVHEADGSKLCPELPGHDDHPAFSSKDSPYADAELAGSEAAGELDTPRRVPSLELPAMPVPPAYFQTRSPS